jgi:hypothetical protein
MDMAMLIVMRLKAVNMGDAQQRLPDLATSALRLTTRK